MSKSKKIYLIIFLLIANKNYLKSGLLPDNVIFTEKNGYCPVKNLLLEDKLASSNDVYKLRKVRSYVSGIKLNRNSINTAILLTLESKNNTLSSIVVGHNQKFYAQVNYVDNYSEELNSFVWLETENLEPNMSLLGYNDELFKIKNVKKIEFENYLDLYDISLKPNNTFYLVDSNGNLIKTHNMLGIIGFVVTGAILGGIVGASITIHHSYAKKVKISKSNVLKGFLIGAATGAICGAITYYGAYFTTKYAASFMKDLSLDFNLKTFINNESFFKATSIAKKGLLLKKQILNLLQFQKSTIFIGTTTLSALGIIMASSAKIGYDYLDNKLKDFIEKTEKKEFGNINVSGIDPKFSDENNLNDYSKMPGNTKILYTEPITDENGNPILDINGNNINLVVASYT